MEDGWETTLLAVRTDLPIEERCYAISGKRLSFASISSAWAPNQAEFIAVDTDRRVWSYKPNAYEGAENNIPFDSGPKPENAYGEFDAAVFKLARVASTVFAVASPFRLFERVGPEQWQEHTSIPIPAALKSPDRDTYIQALGDTDFLDLAGFSTTDMYAVGGAGTVWHRKGEQWREMPFPTKLRLHTVACGGDGFVYITDIRGSVYKGREDRWTQIVKADMSLPFVDAAWFDGRLWLANDYGTWVIEGKNLVPAHQAKDRPMPAQTATHAHRIDVSPDGSRMLVAGGQGASLFDGHTWQVLFDGYDFA
jgi:hypothetical protein